jgi:predicted transcriptional regulator
MTQTVRRAIEAVRQKYSTEEWVSMGPKERTAAIYEEVRRLDAEKAEQQRKQETAVRCKSEPAAPINKSISPDRVVCLDCGKHFSMLKKHLMTEHKLTPEQYRERWELPPSYSMVAPAYAKKSTIYSGEVDWVAQKGAGGTEDGGNGPAEDVAGG